MGDHTKPIQKKKRTNSLQMKRRELEHIMKKVQPNTVM